MKKALIPLAVFGAMSGGVYGQTATTVYGIVDAGISSENTGKSSLTSVSSGNVYGDRLGFKGTEDLGGGMSALYTLEMGFNINDGTMGQSTSLFNRQSFVGLSGRAGTLTLGRQYTTLFRAQLDYDPFFTGFAGNAGHMMSNGGGTQGARTNNSIFYVTPNVSGFEGQLLYGLGGQAGNNQAMREMGGALGYKNGPLNVKVSYHNAIDPAGLNSASNLNLMATYDFGAIKIYASEQNNSRDNIEGTTTPATTTTVTYGDHTRDSLIGMSMPFGSGSFRASFIHKADQTRANANANQLGLGYIYAMSKTTDLYTSVSKINNDALSSIRVVSAGKSDRLFNIGMDHKF
ncbi:MAG: porin [Herbaspirillum sp.]|nr:porin [Herbaspirillum sp.]